MGVSFLINSLYSATFPSLTHWICACCWDARLWKRDLWVQTSAASPCSGPRRIPLGHSGGRPDIYIHTVPCCLAGRGGWLPQDSARSELGYGSQSIQPNFFSVSRFDSAYLAPPPPPASPEGGRDDIWIEGGRGGSAGGRGSIRPWILPMPAGRGGSANGTESSIVGFTEDNIGTEAARPCGLRSNANEEAARPCDVRAKACAKHSSEICAPSTSSTDSDLDRHKNKRRLEAWQNLAGSDKDHQYSTLATIEITGHWTRTRTAELSANH